MSQETRSGSKRLALSSMRRRLPRSKRTIAATTAASMMAAIAIVVFIPLVGPISSCLRSRPFVAYETPPVTSPPATTQCASASSSANPIAAENTCPGTKTWHMDYPLGPAHAIEAFTFPASVDIGKTLHLYVTTTAPSYAFQIYRMGWYNGDGGRLMYFSPTLTGIAQPAPTIDPATGLVSCANWRDPVSIPIPTTWVSGVYVVKLISSQRYMRYTLFTVRNLASASPIVFQTSVTTYQAYNGWGGFSLYRGTDATGQLVPQKRAYAVSFDRPYAAHGGLAEFATYEYGLLRWCERQGYNMSYITDIDLQRLGSALLRKRLIVIAGHDEYYSSAMRESLTRARGAGVSLAFFGADNIYWRIRVQDSSLGVDRVVYCYRSVALDPVAWAHPEDATVRWRDAPLHDPEANLIGAMYAGVVDTSAPLVLAAGAQPYLNGTGWKPGTAIPGLVGGEADMTYQKGSPRDVIILAASPVSCATCNRSSHSYIANTTLYHDTSGAWVFDAATFLWAWGLDDTSIDPASPVRGQVSPAFQRFTANIFDTLMNGQQTLAFCTDQAIHQI